MKHVFTLLLLLVVSSGGYAQKDRNGNPVFNSVTLEQTTWNHLLITASYYTLRNNIDNVNSSVYVAASPTLDQIQHAATKLPANFYILSQDKQMLGLIMLSPPSADKKAYSFLFVNPSTGEKKEMPARLSGDITQSRAEELILNGYDSQARIHESGDQIVFNATTLAIIKKEKIEEQVRKIIKKLKLPPVQESGITFIGKEDLVVYIKTESEKGGKLDFWSKLNVQKGPSDGIQVDGFFMQKQHAAVYLWGKATAELGLESLEQAQELLISLKGEQSKMALMHLESGFQKIVKNK